MKRRECMKWKRIVKKKEEDKVKILVRIHYHLEEDREFYNLQNLARYYPEVFPANNHKFFLQVSRHQEEENKQGRGFQLWLSSNKISDKDISKIDQYRWTSLRNLHLFDNGIGPVGLNYLSQARMESLEEFDLSQNNLGDSSYKFLTRANWKHLKRISLYNNNRMSEKGCRYLSKAAWRELEYINLTNNGIGNKGCPQLCRGGWPKIETIFICGCDVQELGCRLMIKQKYLGSIWCKNNYIGVTGYRFLRYISNSVIENNGYEMEYEEQQQQLAILS